MKKIQLFLISLFLIFSISLSNAEQFTDIIIVGTNGLWTDSRSYSTLNAAITAAGSNQRTILIASPQVVTTLTIPSNITLKFERDGSITNSGQLTINTKNIIADNRQIFTGTGNIDFASGTIVKSGWFANFETALALTVNDTITLFVTKPQTLTTSFALGNNVNLKWESPGNILTANAGVTISNISQVESGDYQIFAGSGSFTFNDGTSLNLKWFSHLRSAIDFINNSKVTLVISKQESYDYSNTVPSNINLKITKGGMLIQAAAYTLTINGPFECGDYQVFSGFSAGDITGLKEARPEWWYAGSGTYETAIKSAALSLSSGGRLALSAVTYTITNEADWIKIPNNVTVEGVGDASVIKVADSNGNYNTIFGPNGATVVTAASNIHFRDFKIDQNIANASGTVTVVDGQYHIAFYFAGATTNLSIENITFDTCSGVNVISINSASATDIQIRHNYFNYSKQSGGTYDASAVYTNANRVTITGNTLVALVSDSVPCAIEAHTGVHTISGNSISGFITGVNVVSESTSATEVENPFTVIGNTMKDVNNGVYLWALTSRVLDGVVVANNAIFLDQVTHNQITTVGIGLYYSIGAVVRGDYKNITIANNIIVFTDETTGRVGQTTPSSCAGVSLRAYGDLYNVIASYNIIKNAPSLGISIGTATSDATNVRITHNIVENFGNNINAIINNYRIGLYMYAASGQTFKNVAAEQNSFRDTNATLRADIAIRTWDGGTITDCHVRDNYIDSVNGTMTVIIEEVFQRTDITTNTSLTNYDAWNGKTYSNTGASGTITATLPVAAIGMEIAFVRIASQVFMIDPNGTNTITGGTAGKYLSLDSNGAFVKLQCFQTNVWTITSSIGTTSFEAP